MFGAGACRQGVLVGETLVAVIAARGAFIGSPDVENLRAGTARSGMEWMRSAMRRACRGLCLRRACQSGSMRIA